MKLTKEEQFVRDELAKAYPQLQINCQKTCGWAYDKWGGDLLAMSIEFFLDKPLEQQLKTIKDGKIVNFITFIMGLQIKSSTSRFWHKYRKHNEKQRELYPNLGYKSSTGAISDTHNTAFEDEEDEVYSCMKRVIDTFNPYEKMLVDEFIYNNSKFSDVTKQYNINYAALKKDLERVKLQIKRKCKHYR